MTFKCFRMNVNLICSIGGDQQGSEIASFECPKLKKS